MRIILLALTFLFAAATSAQDATEIVRKADQKLRGKSSKAEVSITIVRPRYTREMKSIIWSEGDDYAMILITSPSKDRGTTFLKRGKEIWNWVPSIERTIKLPPSMMSQDWMGTDFKNDDLVKQNSMVADYDHKLLGEETIDGYKTYKVELTPKPDAAVVWGKVVLWIDKDEYMELRGEFYDEDGFLVNEMHGKEPKVFDGKMLPSIMEMVPADKEGQKTVMSYDDLQFDIDITPDFFTVRNMKGLR